MNLANAKRVLLGLVLLSFTMGSSSYQSSTDSTTDPLSWTNILGLGPCTQESPITVPAPTNTDSFAVTGNKALTATAGYPVALAYLVTGGHAPYFASFDFGDGTGVNVPVSMYQSYAATSHSYSATGYYYGGVTVSDAWGNITYIEFRVQVTAN